jgi:hypothetical protein
VTPAIGEDVFGLQEQTPAEDARRDADWVAELGQRLNYLTQENDPDAYLFNEADEDGS